MLIKHLKLYFEDCRFHAEQSLEKLNKKRAEIEAKYTEETSKWYTRLAFRLVSRDYWHQFTINQYDELKVSTQKYIDECEGFIAMLEYREKYENVTEISETDPILARVKLDDFYKFARKFG